MSPCTSRALSAALILAVVTANLPSPRATPPSALATATLRTGQVEDTAGALKRSGLEEALGRDRRRPPATPEAIGGWPTRIEVTPEEIRHVLGQLHSADYAPRREAIAQLTDWLQTAAGHPLPEPLASQADLLVGALESLVQLFSDPAALDNLGAFQVNPGLFAAPAEAQRLIGLMAEYPQFHAALRRHPRIIKATQANADQRPHAGLRDAAHAAVTALYAAGLLGSPTQPKATPRATPPGQPFAGFGSGPSTESLRTGLEEPVVVIQPGTKEYERLRKHQLRSSMPRKAVRAYLIQRVHGRMVLRVTPETWSEAQALAQDGFVPALNAHDVAAHLKQIAQWSVAPPTQDAERRDTMAVTFPSSTPLPLPRGFPPVQAVRVVPTNSKVFANSREFSAGFRAVVDRLSRKVSVVADRQPFLQEMGTYLSMGRLELLGIPYVIPDAGSAEQLTRAWGLPSGLVVSEADYEAQRRARAAPSAGATPNAAGQLEAAWIQLAAAVRGEATQLHHDLSRALRDRQGNQQDRVVQADPAQLQPIRSRLTPWNPTTPERLLRWIRQEFPGGATVAEVRMRLQRERAELEAAIAGLREHASALHQSVARMAEIFPAEGPPAEATFSAAHRAIVLEAPGVLESVAAAASDGTIAREAQVFARLDPLVQRVQAALRTDRPADPDLQAALQRWQALAVALLSATGVLTEPTAAAFFETPGALERDLWYWVAFGLRDRKALHIVREGQINVSSWAEGGVMILLAHPGDRSSIPAQRLDPRKPARAVVRTVIDSADNLKDTGGLTEADPGGVCEALSEGLRQPPFPQFLKVGLLLRRKDAVWNVSAVFAHLAAAVAQRIGYTRTSAYFAEAAARRYARARGLRHDLLWEPTLPPLNTLPGMTAPTEGRVADLAGRLTRGERADGVSPAELVAVIGRLGTDVQYHLVTIQPIHHGTRGQRWVWFNGAWQPVPSAKTNLQGVIHEELQKMAAWAMRVHGLRTGHVTASDLPEVTARGEGEALEVTYPSLSAETLTQMVKVQQQLGPPGTVLCTLQPAGQTNGARQVRVEVAAIPAPLPATAGPSTESLGAGLEEDRAAPTVRERLDALEWLMRELLLPPEQPPLSEVVTALLKKNAVLRAMNVTWPDVQQLVGIAQFPNAETLSWAELVREGPPVTLLNGGVEIIRAIGLREATGRAVTPDAVLDDLRSMAGAFNPAYGDQGEGRPFPRAGDPEAQDVFDALKATITKAIALANLAGLEEPSALAKQVVEKGRRVQNLTLPTLLQVLDQIGRDRGVRYVYAETCPAFFDAKRTRIEVIFADYRWQFPCTARGSFNTRSLVKRIHEAWGNEMSMPHPAAPGDFPRAITVRMSDAQPGSPQVSVSARSLDQLRIFLHETGVQKTMRVPRAPDGTMTPGQYVTYELVQTPSRYSVQRVLSPSATSGPVVVQVERRYVATPLSFMNAAGLEEPDRAAVMDHDVEVAAATQRLRSAIERLLKGLEVETPQAVVVGPELLGTWFRELEALRGLYPALIVPEHADQSREVLAAQVETLLHAQQQTTFWYVGEVGGFDEIERLARARGLHGRWFDLQWPSTVAHDESVQMMRYKALQQILWLLAGAPDEAEHPLVPHVTISEILRDLEILWQA